METRIPKNRYNGSGINTDDRKAQQSADTADIKGQDALKEIGTMLDKQAAGVAQTVTDMFKFMSLTAAVLPNMELDTGIFHLKVDDDGILFEISHPFRKDKQHNTYEDGTEEPNNDYDDDEEGLIYDGD